MTHLRPETETKGKCFNCPSVPKCDVFRSRFPSHMFPFLLLLLSLLQLFPLTLQPVEAQQIAEGYDFACYITDEPQWAYTYPTPLTANDTLASIDCSGTIYGNGPFPMATLVPKVVGPFAQISGGYSHVIGLLRNGSVMLFGGPAANFAIPDSVRRSRVIQVAAGQSHSCVLLEDFTATCFGVNFQGECDVPQDIQFKEIAAGGFITCGITMSNASIICFGVNFNSQVTNVPASDPNDPFVQVSASPTAEFVCALRRSGSVLCWGASPGATPSIPDMRTISVGVCGISLSTAVGSDFPCVVACGSGLPLCLQRMGRSFQWTQQLQFVNSPYSQFGYQVALTTSGRVEGMWIYARKNSVLQVGPQRISALYTDGIMHVNLESSPGNVNITKYSAVEYAGCGLTNTSTIVCSSRASSLSANINPSDTFTSISLSYDVVTRVYYFLTAVNSFGRLQFYGSNAYALGNLTAAFNPPPLRDAVSTASGVCGWGTDGRVVCFGNQVMNSTVPLLHQPFGSEVLSFFTNVADANGLQLCGIRASDSTAVCAVIDVINYAQPRVPFAVPTNLQFLSISANSNLFCGILLSNSTIFCATPTNQYFDVPLGTFAQVAPLEGGGVCGIRSDASIICTGQLPVTPPLVSLPIVVSLAPAFTFQSNNGTAPCPIGSIGHPGYITPICGGPCSSGPDCKLGCQEGYYCVSGVDVYICPKGNFCPANTYNSPLPCPVGRYGSSTGLTNSSCSGDCPAKYYCLSGTIDYSTMLCPVGQFCANSATQCPVPCDAGYLGNLPGNDQSHCNGPCPAGYLCDFGTSSLVNSSCPISNYCQFPATLKPIICPVGHYCPQGSVLPSPCDAGTYGITEGLSTSSCSAPCPTGFLCSNGSTNFIDSLCPSGWACPVIGTTNVTKQQCAGGFYCPLQSTSSKQVTCGSRSVYCPPGSSSPIPIDSGSYGVFNASLGESELTQSGQRLCQAGHFCDGSGVMKPCAAGQYSEFSGADTCIPCGFGQYAGPAATSCSTCEAGKFSSHPDQPCADCSAGSFSLGKAASCSPCDIGSASNDVARNSSCLACGPGKYADRSGLTQCTACLSPFYTPTPSLCLLCDNIVSSDGRSCVNSACPANTQLNPASRECEPCPLSTASVAGGTCLKCPQTFYTPSVGSGCVSCLDSNTAGLSCDSGFASVLPDYWAFRVPPPGELTGDRSALTFVYHTAECPSNFCQGGPLQQLPTNWPSTANGTSNSTSLSIGRDSNSLTDSADVQMLLEAAQCAWPRLQSSSNYLCGRCETGYKLWDGRCVRCESAQGGLVFLTVVLSLALVAFFIRSAALASSTAASRSSSAAVSIILLYFLQTAAIEIGAVSKYLSWFQIANFGLQSTAGTGDNGNGCLAPLDSQEQLVLQMSVPFIFMAEIAVVASFHFMLANSGVCRRPESPEQNAMASARSFLAHFDGNLYIGALFSSMLFCYTGVASSCLAFFSCVQVGDARILFQFPQIRCDQPSYGQGLAYALTMLIVYIIGFPLGSVVFLWRRWSSVQAAHRAKQQQNDEQRLDSGALAPESVDNVAMKEEVRIFLTRFGLLFSVYHESAWFWQSVILLRRSLFVAAAAALASNQTYRFLTFLYLNMASTILHMRVEPFQSNWLNTVETCSNWVLMAISALLESGAPYPQWVQILLLLLLIIPVFTLLVFLIRRNWHHVEATINTRLERRSTRGKSHQDAQSPDHIQSDENKPRDVSTSAKAVSAPVNGTVPVSPSADVELMVISASEHPVAPTIDVLIPQAHGRSDFAEL